jgi:hypothetical protein
VYRFLRAYNHFKDTFMTGHTEQNLPHTPSPSGEGQTATPINHHNQGEVLIPRIEKSVFIIKAK